MQAETNQSHQATMFTPPLSSAFRRAPRTPAPRLATRNVVLVAPARAGANEGMAQQLRSKKTRSAPWHQSNFTISEPTAAPAKRALLYRFGSGQRRLRQALLICISAFLSRESSEPIEASTFDPSLTEARTSPTRSPATHPFTHPPVCLCGGSTYVHSFSVRRMCALLRPLYVPRELLLVISPL